MSGIMSVLYFLATMFFNLVIFTLWVRVALRYFHVSAMHPVGQLVYTLTEPVIRPLEKVLRPRKTPVHTYDWVSMLVIFALELVKFMVVGLLIYKALIPVPYLLLLAAGDFIVQPCNFLFYLIVIRVVMSWVNPFWQHPVVPVIHLMTEPVLRLGRRLIPPIAGFDFSPIIVLLLLKVIILFVTHSLPLSLF
ncbi:MAG: YggT family protein [Legionella sp.]|nr:YggT family protein [Legionella sp.]